MRTIILLITTINYSLLTINCSAQPTQEWVRRWDSQWHSGDAPSKMVLDRFGNIIVTGSIGTTSQGNDIATVKYNSGGTQQWAVTYNQTSNTNDLATGIAADSSGNIYVTGTTGYNLGPFDMVTIKYSPSGVQQWARVYQGTAGSRDDGGGDISVDGEGNIYVCGATGDSYDFGNAFLIKYNPVTGDSIWVRRYSNNGLFASFGSVKIDRFDNIYVAGTFFYYQFPNIAGIHALTAKYDSSGGLLWAVRYISSTINANDYLSRLAVDSSANVYVTGATYVGTPSTYLTIKYSSSGVQQWVRNYTGPYGANNEGRSIVTDDSGNTYVSGISTGSGNSRDVASIKYNNSGDSMWVRRYNSSIAYVTQVVTAVDDSGDVYVTASTENSGVSITTIKYSSIGVQKWVALYPGQTADITVDASRNVYVSEMNNLNGTGFDYITIKYSQISGVQPLSNEIPDGFELYQNYPNPFNQLTIINYQLPTESDVSLTIFDVMGREVESLVNERQRAGTYQIDFDASSVSSGIYFYKLKAGELSETRKLSLVK